MSTTLRAHHVGLAVGGLLGLLHLCWSLFVAFGLAQPLLDWVFRLHMIEPPYIVQPFSFTMALSLIVVTALFGYVIGFVLATIWNLLPKK